MSLTERPLVSIITGTWQRHQLLIEAVENVRQQTYKPVEHVVVSDGPDPDLAVLLKAYRHSLSWNDRPHVRQFELGFHSSSLLSNSISALPFLVAQSLARGEYAITMSDDERFLDTEAVAKLVDALEAENAQFAYSSVEMHIAASGRTFVIGADPPSSGQITQFLYRREMLDRGAMFRTHIGNATDFDCVKRMMDSGGKWAFVPEVLASHVAHK